MCLKAYAGLGCMDVGSIPCYLISEHVHVDAKHVEIRSKPLFLKLYFCILVYFLKLFFNQDTKTQSVKEGPE